jgi:hypothetical protein
MTVVIAAGRREGIRVVLDVLGVVGVAFGALSLWIVRTEKQ